MHVTNNDFEVSDRRDIAPSSIQQLRESVGWIADEETAWQQILGQAIRVSSVYDGDKLVGIGFLTGTPRHAELCDVCVSPDHQSKGIGQAIVKTLVEAAKNQGIRYVNLTYNEKSPWLADFYESMGFKSINNAMMLDHSERA